MSIFLEKRKHTIFLEKEDLTFKIEGPICCRFCIHPPLCCAACGRPLLEVKHKDKHLTERAAKLLEVKNNERN